MIKIPESYKELFEKFIAKLPKDIEYIEAGTGSNLRLIMRIKNMPTYSVGNLAIREKYFTVVHNRKGLESIRVREASDIDTALDSVMKIYSEVKDPRIQASIYVPNSIWNTLKGLSNQKINTLIVDILTEYVANIEEDNAYASTTVELVNDTETLVISGKNLKIIRKQTRPTE